MILDVFMWTLSTQTLFDIGDVLVLMPDNRLLDLKINSVVVNIRVIRVKTMHTHVYLVWLIKKTDI